MIAFFPYSGSKRVKRPRALSVKVLVKAVSQPKITWWSINSSLTWTTFRCPNFYTSDSQNGLNRSIGVYYNLERVHVG
ncbi:hypothetical protein TNCV_3825641 [Trichonephila clavipes]|nr:hypothetical protein TNCV_3825641 [Trichonephila clavipes]